MRKWLGRIWEGIELVVLTFIVGSILNKLIFKDADWLARTLALSIPYLFAKPIIYYYLVDKKRKRWPLVVSTAICVFIGSLFLLGVCLSVDGYWLRTFRLTYFSTVAMAFVIVDERRDEKRSSKLTKEKVNVDVVV